MKKFLPMVFPCAMLIILVALVLNARPMVFFVTSESAIPAAVKVVAQPPVIKAGQVWEMEGRDPFRKDVVAARIVAVKDGYVKYYFRGQENFGEWAAQSDSARTFATIYTKLVK